MLESDFGIGKNEAIQPRFRSRDLPLPSWIITNDSGVNTVPSLAFGFMTRCDLSHYKWSILQTYLRIRAQELCEQGSRPWLSFPMELSTDPRWSPISTNRRREMLLFLARILVSHAGIPNNGSAHTDSLRFCRFWFNRPIPNTAKWLYGCLQGNRLRTISSSNLYRHHWQNLGFVLSSFSSSVILLSFFLCLYRLIRFMAFQSVLVGTTPAFTIIINSNKRSLLGQYITILLSDLNALCNILRRFQR